jgi:hypothetical protein
MTKRTRLFLFGAAGILVIGLGTGLVASYMDLQNLVIVGADGPEELEYVSSDARVVAFANVREIMDSELRQRIVAFSRQGTPGSDGEQFKEQTGIDIERDIDEVLASVAAPDGEIAHDGPPLVLARGRFDRVRIEGAAREKGGAAEDYRGTRLLTHKDSNLGVAFLEPGLVALGPIAAVRRAIDTKAARGQNARDNVELMRLVRESDDGNAWAVARFDALTAGGRLPNELATQLPAISWFAATGHVNGGIRGTLRAETRDEMAAQDLRQVLQGFVALARMQTSQRPEFSDVLSSIELGGTGNTVSLGFSVPPELIDSIGAMHAARPGRTPVNPPAPPQPPPAPRGPSL